MDLQTHYYKTTAGFQLALHCSLPTGKPVLYFTHGNGFASKMYEPMLRHLIDHYDLVLLDAQGHGDSEHGGAFVGWNRSSDFAAAAYQTMMNRYPTTVHIGIGHSFGGVLTALMQAKYQLFQRIVLLDPVLFPPAMLLAMRLLKGLGIYQHNRLAKRARSRRHQFESYQQAFAYFNQRGLFRGWHEDALHAYLRHAMHQDGHGMRLKCSPQRESDIFASFPHGLWQQLHGMRARTDLLLGQNSYPFVHQSARRLQRVAHDVHLHQQPGGHCFMQEQPLPTALLIRQLLSSSQ